MLAIFGDSDILFFVMRDMTDIEKKIHKLNVDIVLNGRMRSLCPIKDHRIKVNLFNIARQELLDQDLKDRVKKLQKSDI